MSRYKVYCAGPWFTNLQEQVQTELENYIKSRSDLVPYFPRHDGVKLEAGQIHQPGMREKVFNDNIRHIEDADLIIANLDGSDGFQDTGTCYEVGYAMALGIPVIGYQRNYDGKLNDHMSSVIGGFYAICSGINELGYILDKLKLEESNNIKYTYEEGSKVLYIAPDNSQVNVEKSTELASILVECFGKDFRWVDKLSNNPIYSCIDTMFKDVKYMTAVIDDRHPIVSWMMGQCFARHIPIVSYTNYNYDINLMLGLSVFQHIKGPDAMKELIHIIKREGLSSINKVDTSNLKMF